MIGALDLEGPQGYLQTRGKHLCRLALERGVYLRPLGNTVYVTPALNIPEPELDELLGVLGDCVQAVAAT
jgi:adenosylmethionine-8-amino-7-oxononanoate aminotransferase